MFFALFVKFSIIPTVVAFSCISTSVKVIKIALPKSQSLSHIDMHFVWILDLERTNRGIHGNYRKLNGAFDVPKDSSDDNWNNWSKEYTEIHESRL